MFWDLFSGISEQGFKDSDFTKKIGFNSTWNTTLGDAITNVIGGSRFANVIGSDAKVVFDWEEMVMRGLLYKWPKSKFLALISHGAGGAACFGIGGDTSMVFGNKTSFTYFTDKADCEIGVSKITVNWDFPSEINLAALSSWYWYYFPMIVAGLGVIVMTVMTLCLKYIWKFSSSNRWTVDTNSGNPTLKNLPDAETPMNLAMLLYPLLETRWLALVKGCHIFSLTSVPLKAEIENSAVSGFAARSTLITVFGNQLVDIEIPIQQAREKCADFQKRIAKLESAVTENKTLANLFAWRLDTLRKELEYEEEQVAKYTSKKEEIIANIAKKTKENENLMKFKPPSP